MTALTRHGAITGVDGLVIATIRESVVIYGKLINPAYGAPGEPDIATSRPIWAPQGYFPILAYIVAGLFSSVRIRCAIRTYELQCASWYTCALASLKTVSRITKTTDRYVLTQTVSTG